MVVILVTSPEEWGAQIHSALERCGVSIDLVEPTTEAVTRAVAGHPDVVLLDLERSQGHLTEWIGIVRSASATAEIIVLGESLEVANGVAVLRGGALEYLPKWLQAEALFYQICRAYRRKKRNEKRLGELRAGPVDSREHVRH